MSKQSTKNLSAVIVIGLLLVIQMGLTGNFDIPQVQAAQLPGLSSCKAQGEMCGGIGGFVCCSDLTCILDGNYPDASGTCVPQGTLTIVISSPENSQIFSKPSISVKGTGIGSPTSVIVEAVSMEYMRRDNHQSYANSVEAAVVSTGASFVFEAELPLVIGMNRIKATAYDSSGNQVSTFLKQTINVLYLISPNGKIYPPFPNSCPVSPVLTTMSGFAQFYSPIDFDQKDTKVLPIVTINGFNADVYELQTFLPRTPGEPNYAGHYTLPLDLGKNTITAITTDRFGQTTSDSITVWRLTLDVDYPKEGQIINQSPITVRGGGSGNPDRVAVQVNNKQATIYPNGPDFYTFEAPISFSQEGPQTITVTACDKNLCVYSEYRTEKTINVIYQPGCVGEGKMCGGIAGIRCCSGLSCQLEGNYPDASGMCTVSTLTSPSTPTLRSNLGIGMKNDDVKKLQEFLAKDKTIYPEGLITGYFGPLTTKAIQRFQCKYNIVCSGDAETTGYGNVGPKTRGKINGLLK